MQAELKAKWIAALRSGGYQQGRDRLRDGMQFCCLGVLCEVANVPRDPEGYRFEDYVRNTVPPDNWHLNREDQNTLIGMNDKGKSFAEIADWIEAHL